MTYEMSDIFETITFEIVEKWVSKKVDIYFNEEDIRSAKIIEVNALSKKNDLNRIPFSVVLLTDLTEAYYEQGTFKVILPNDVEEYLFMVPIGVDSESRGMQYELVFN